MITRTSVLFFLYVSLSFGYDSGFGKDYYKIRNQKVKKATFISTLLPKIKKAEKEILADRLFVEKFFNKYLFTYSMKARYDMERLIKISKRYRIKKLFNEAEYLMKVDAIPVSLVLAQSAVESAWGESRFAKEGNNLFGEWTWGKVGLIPQGRDDNATHRLRIFATLDASIARYMLNLNRHRSYKEFRLLRASKRTQKQPFTGLEAAKKMTQYSQMREVYSKLLATVIKGNKFARYDIGFRRSIPKTNVFSRLMN